MSVPTPTTALVASIATQLSGHDEVDSPLVDRAVREINQIYAAKGLETARLLGEYVVATFFGGQLSAFDKNQKDHQSFRALAERDDLRVSKSFLWYSVKLLPQIRALPEQIALALPLSHHRLLLHVSDMDAREQLAKRAVESDFSKRELEIEIREARKKSGTISNAGRKSLPGFQKTIGKLSRVLKAEDALGDMDELHVMNEVLIRELYQTVSAALSRCHELQHALEKRLQADKAE